MSGLDSEERNQVKKAVEDEGENSRGREESIVGAYRWVSGSMDERDQVYESWGRGL